jgi:hypothetical protein
LGEDANIETLVVHWPGGQREAWNKLEADQIVHIRQGTGRVIQD